MLSSCEKSRVFFPLFQKNWVYLTRINYVLICRIITNEAHWENILDRFEICFIIFCIFFFTNNYFLFDITFIEGYCKKTMYLQIRSNDFRSIKMKCWEEGNYIERKITRNTNKSLLQNSRSSNVPNTRNPRNIPEYKILEVYKSTRVITIVLRFTRNKLIIGRQAKVVVIVNKNQIYRTLLWHFHKGKPNSKGGLGSGPLGIPLAHADLTHMHLFFGQRNGVECVARW